MDEILCQFGADILDTSDLIKILSFHQALHVFRLHISSGATCSGRALCRVSSLFHPSSHPLFLNWSVYLLSCKDLKVL